jgi:hypothetical protein
LIIYIIRLIGVALASPPAIEETGAMDREIESRYGIGVVAFKEKRLLGVTNPFFLKIVKKYRIL